MRIDEKSQGFDALMEQYLPRVRRYAFRLMDNPEDAEDLIQDTCIAAFRNFEGFRGDSRFSTWLFQIERNLGINKLKARKLNHEMFRLSYMSFDCPDHVMLSLNKPGK